MSLEGKLELPDKTCVNTGKTSISTEKGLHEMEWTKECGKGSLRYWPASKFPSSQSEASTGCYEKVQSLADPPCNRLGSDLLWHEHKSSGDVSGVWHQGTRSGSDLSHRFPWTHHRSLAELCIATPMINVIYCTCWWILMTDRCIFCNTMYC